MLRTTAARAFTALAGRAALDHEPAAPRNRREAVDRLFLAIQRSFADRIREAALHKEVFREEGKRAERRDRGGRGRGFEGGDLEDADPRVSEVRAVLTGVEFAVGAPGASYRFLNTRRGVISVDELRDGRLRRLEVISVERGEGGYRTIRKLSSRRSGYLFDSPDGIADSYLRAVERREPEGEPRGNVECDERAKSESTVCRVDPAGNLVAYSRASRSAAVPLPTDGLSRDGRWTRG